MKGRMTQRMGTSLQHRDNGGRAYDDNNGAGDSVQRGEERSGSGKGKTRQVGELGFAREDEGDLINAGSRRMDGAWPSAATDAARAANAPSMNRGGRRRWGGLGRLL